MKYRPCQVLCLRSKMPGEFYIWNADCSSLECTIEAWDCKSHYFPLSTNLLKHFHRVPCLPHLGVLERSPFHTLRISESFNPDSLWSAERPQVLLSMRWSLNTQYLLQLFLAGVGGHISLRRRQNTLVFQLAISIYLLISGFKFISRENKVTARK